MKAALDIDFQQWKWFDTIEEAYDYGVKLLKGHLHDGDEIKHRLPEFPITHKPMDRDADCKDVLEIGKVALQIVSDDGCLCRTMFVISETAANQELAEATENREWVEYVQGRSSKSTYSTGCPKGYASKSGWVSNDPD